MPSCIYSNAKSAQSFGAKLKRIIVENNRQKFMALSCFPVNCIDQGDVNFVFGSNSHPSTIKSFLINPDIKMKVFGPFDYDDHEGNNDYILMYYLPNIVAFEKNGTLSDKSRKDMWWKGYVETVISYHNGQWHFHRTPFYHGAHLPWEKDY